MSNSAARLAAAPSPEATGVGETWPEVLRHRAQTSPEKVHILLEQDTGEKQEIRFGELYRGAAAAASALRDRGLGAGEPVAIMLPTCREFFFTFLGTLLAGGVPVPIYPPLRAEQIEEYARRQAAILANAEARILVTFREAEGLARLLGPRVPSLAAVVRGDQLLDGGPASPPEVTPKPDDLAFIQYTSGSTGEPKGVALTHANLVANVRAIARGVKARTDDIVICWLPLYHDMGLIGCWLFSLYFGLRLVSMSPLAFLRRPERWLWAFDHHRGTLSPAPNFAYELCVRKVSEAAVAGLDLSSWRVALNGAEPILPETLERFLQRYARHGFRAEAMMPVYGLAESTVALAFAPEGTAPRVDAVQRRAFESGGRATPAAPGNADALRFVCVGRPLPGHEVRIVDEQDRPVPERVEGHLQFRGPSSMQGYYRNLQAPEAARCGDWYRTGDLAYLAEGELFITGRTKDLIIQAGRNVHPQEIEALAADVEGIRRGCVVAFSVPDPKTGTEALVLVAETRAAAAEAKRRMAAEVKRRVAAGAGISPQAVILVPPHVIPKTPSGKLQRRTCRQLYLEGKLGGARLPIWLQVTRLAAQSAWLEIKKAVGKRP